MTTAVRALLGSFDSLSEAERQEAAAEILRRAATAEGEPADRALVEADDGLFRLLDAEAAADARPRSRRGLDRRSGAPKNPRWRYTRDETGGVNGHGHRPSE